MSKKALDDFYFKAYEAESNRRHQLSTYLPFRFTLIGFVGGLLGNNLQSSANNDTLFDSIVIFFGLTAIVPLLISIYYIMRFHFGHDYNYVSFPDEISEYFEKLQDYYNNTNQSLAEIEDYIRKEQVDCASQNMRNNDKKSKSIYLSDKWLSIAALLAMFTFWSYVAEAFFEVPTQPCSTTSITTMPNENEDSAPPPPVSPPTQEKPTPPQRRIIKESEIRPKKIQ